MVRSYAPALPSVETLLRTMSFVPETGPWRAELIKHHSEFEQICLDRYLRIVQAMQSLNLYDCSMLDLGCSSGFFSYCFAITMASQVTAVDDERAVGIYGAEASLRPLEDARARYDLQHLEIQRAPIEAFLAQESGRRRWDVVLCLAVLHHLKNGYADDQSTKLSDEAFRALCARLGEVTGKVLFVTVDASRIDVQELHRDLQDIGEFDAPQPLGLTASGTGEPRMIWQFLKRASQ